MNFLFITHHYLKGNSGGCFASRAYINSFAEIGNVSLICPSKKGCEPEKINPRVRITEIFYDKGKLFKVFDLLKGKIDRSIGFLEKELKHNKYDIVVFDSSMPSFKQIDLVHKYGSKVITIHHNYQVEYTRDNVKGIIGKILLYWIEKSEKEAVIKSDLNITLTEDDKVLLHKFYDIENKANIKVLGTYEYQDLRPFLLIDNEIHDRNHLRFLITGSLSAVQTYESLYVWLHKYLPILKDICPSCSLTIAGKNPSNKLCDLCELLGVHVIPSPESMDDVLLNADYYICPIELGGGLKLRIMDGLKAGLPVLTHDVSLRGYEMFKDKFVFSYNDIHSFKESLKRMISSDCSNWEIQKEYLKWFAFKSGVERMKELVNSIM